MEEIETGYRQVRYISDFTDVQLAKGAMKTAEAYDAPGIGRWKVEVVGGVVHYVFMPGKMLIIMLDRDKSGFFWQKLGKDTAEMFAQKLPLHKFTYLVE